MLVIILTWDTALCFSPDRLNRILAPKIFVCSECLRGKLSIEYIVQFEEIIFLESCSFEHIKEKLQRFIGNNNVFLAAVDEDIMFIAAQIREYYGLPGDKPQSILPFTNKLLMKETLKNANVSLPKYLCFEPEVFKKTPERYLNDIVQSLSFPIFAKPIDGTGTSHTTKIINLSDLSDWCKKHLDSQMTFELDEYIEAEAFHCDSVVQNGVITNTYVAKYSCPCFEFLQNRVLGTITFPQNSEDYQKICEINEIIVDAMHGPKNYATHLELFKKQNGEFVFLEIAARTPGAWVSYIHERFFGFNSQELFLYLQLAQKIDFSNFQTSEYGACLLFPSRNGVVKERVALPDLESRNYLQWKIRTGDTLKNPENILHPVCMILLLNKNYEQLVKEYELLQKFKPIIYAD